MLVKTEADGTQTYCVYGLGLIGQEQGGEYLTYHSDFRGSTVALTDANAQVTELFQYSPYGVLVRYHAETTPFLFNGMSGVMTDSHPSPISVLVRGEKEMPSNNGMSPSFLTFLVALLLLLLMTGFAFVTGSTSYLIPENSQPGAVIKGTWYFGSTTCNSLETNIAPGVIADSPAEAIQMFNEGGLTICAILKGLIMLVTKKGLLVLFM